MATDTIVPGGLSSPPPGGAYTGANSQGQQGYNTPLKPGQTQPDSYTRKETGIGTPQYATTWKLNPATTQPASSVGIVTSNQSQTNFNNQGSDATMARNAQIANLQKQIADTQAEKENAIKLGYGANDQIKKDANGNIVAPDSGSVTGADGSTTLYDAAGNAHVIPAGTDLTTARAQIQSADDALATITSDQATLNKLLQYDVNADPDAVQAAKSISDSYDVLIAQMDRNNKMLVGTITKNSAMNGMLGTDMQGMYNNDAVSNGIQRIKTLQSQEADAIYKSNAAFKSGNVKLLDQASKDLVQAKKDSRQAVLDVQKTIDDQIKTNDTNKKLADAEAKVQNTQDITNSKAIAQATLDQIKASGITDQTQIDAFVKEVATANGISNPAILQGQMSILDPQSGTGALKNENIASTIANRNKPKVTAPPKPKVDGGFSYTPADVSQGISLLNTGGTAPDGTVLGGKGAEYVNTGTYVYMYNNWTSSDNKGTPKGFLKEFPVASYVNPDDYGSLPAPIRPKPAAGTTSFTITK